MIEGEQERSIGVVLGVVEQHSRSPSGGDRPTQSMFVCDYSGKMVVVYREKVTQATPGATTLSPPS